MKQHMKRYLAMALAFVMVFTMFPTGAMGQVRAEEAPKPVLHYDMSHADGKLTDISGNHLDGTLQGITDSDFSETEEGTVLNFDGSAKYVEIPAGVIKNGGSYVSPSEGSEESFTIEATYTDSTQSTAWLFTLGTTVGSYPNVKNYLFVAPYVSDGAYSGKMLAAIKDSSTEKRYPSTNVIGGDSTGKNIVTVVFDKGNVTYYLNGQKSDVTESGFSIQSILAANSTETCIGYIGKSLYNSDANFKGTVSDFKIYDTALTTEQVNAIHNELAQEKAVKSVEGKLLPTMLNGNESTEEVTTDLSFPAKLDDVSLAWRSSDETIVDNTGKIIYTGDEIKPVTITVTGTYNDAQAFVKEYTLQVTNRDGAEYQALTIPDMDNIKGNITLPKTGKYGSEIVWASSNEEVISTTEKAGVNYDSTPAGVVTRQAQDTKVTLTATLKQAGGDKNKVFEVTVKAKAQVGEMTDYVFAYFIGNNPGEEEIFLAASRDGLNWEELNGGKALLESDMGTKGLRDPYIFRSAEGDKFYLIATDLRICTDWDWTAAQTSGSQAIMVWESEDLVHWSDQRMVTVSDKIDAGCTWAPEVFYDDQTGEYLVFWASKVKADNYAKQRLYYCKTRDFYTFTEPKVWIDEDHSTIDSTVVRDTDGTYYRVTKNESKTYVYMEKSDSLLGDWTMVNSNIASGVEGPCAFAFNSDDGENAGAKWCLLVDAFGAGGYYPMVTDDLAGGEFTKISANLPAKPRHGTVMNITAEEYKTLVEAYGSPSLTKDSLPGIVTTGYTLPNEIEVMFAGEKKRVAVTWDKTAEDFKTAGSVTVTGTIPSMNNSTVSKTIEVIEASDKLIYFIDSGVGSWNSKLSESGTYNAVGQAVELRNLVPDQTYTEGSWGIVNPEDGSVVGNRTSETDSIYANGWWAKGGKNCEYIIPLESGSYTATGYFGEWWSVTRPLKFYVEYTDDNGKVVKSNEVSLEINGTTANAKASVDFTVENVAGTAEVHFLAVKGGSSDPVIAGLAIEKNLTDTEAEAEAKAKEEAKASLENVAVTPAETSLYVNDTAKISVAYPADFEAKLAAAKMTAKVSYTSSDSSVAQVDSQGQITAAALGTAVITTKVEISSKTAKEFTTTVTVKEKTVVPPEVAVTGVTLSKTALTLEVGKSSTLTATVAPANATNKTVTWSSSNTKVATVSGGKVTAKAAGTAKITVKTANGKTAVCKVTVKTPVVKVTKVKLSKTKATLGVKEKLTLKATITPGNATNKKITWSTSNKKVATVSSKGVVTAKKKGTATITATVDGKKATCKITVKEAPKKITLNAKTKTLKKGKTFQIKVKLPKNTASNQITYTSSNKKVATVSSTGKVKAVKKGKATITVKTFNGKKATVKITVK